MWTVPGVTLGILEPIDIRLTTSDYRLTACTRATARSGARSPHQCWNTGAWTWSVPAAPASGRRIRTCGRASPAGREARGHPIRLRKRGAALPSATLRPADPCHNRKGKIQEEHVASEDGKAKQSRAEKIREQSMVEQSRAEQSVADQSRAERSRGDQSRAEQSGAGRSRGKES
jgi:hypothetical protein